MLCYKSVTVTTYVILNKKVGRDFVASLVRNCESPHHNHLRSYGLSSEGSLPVPLVLVFSVSRACLRRALFLFHCFHFFLDPSFPMVNFGGVGTIIVPTAPTMKIDMLCRKLWILEKLCISA